MKGLPPLPVDPKTPFEKSTKMAQKGLMTEDYRKTKEKQKLGSLAGQLKGMK